MTVTEIAHIWTKITAKEPNHATGLTQTPWWDQWRGLLKKQWYDMARQRYLIQWVSLLSSNSPNGVFLERYWQFEINELERWRTGRRWLAREASGFWAVGQQPSSCVVCAASLTTLTPGQRARKSCSAVAVDYRYSGCGLNKKKQHYIWLLAILKIKLVVWSDSIVLNTQISAEDDELVIHE